MAVVDAKTLKVTGHFDLGEKGNGPAGLAIDAKNHILFRDVPGRERRHADVRDPERGGWEGHHDAAAGGQQRRRGV